MAQPLSGSRSAHERDGPENEATSRSLPSGRLGPLDPLRKAENESGKRSTSQSAPDKKASSRQAALRVDYVALPIVVTIPRADIEQGFTQQRVLFVVEVSGFGVTSQSRYTFDQFETLYAAVTQVTRFQLPPLPPSQWFGASKQDVVEDRRGRLESLLQKMLMLQEVVDDADQQLWQFLNLPSPVVVAARFLCCQPSNRRHWLQQLWETSAEGKGHLPLQHPLVEKQLVQLLHYAERSASSMEGEVCREVAEGDDRVASIIAKEAADAFAQASIACELLARIFGRTGEIGRPASLGTEPDRHEWLEVLLICSRIPDPNKESVSRSPRAPPESGRERADSADWQNADSTMVPPPLREAAVKALRTLARSNREAWTESLAKFMDIGGISHLAATATGDRDEGGGRQPLQRLVTELLLRGYEKLVVAKLADCGVAKERRVLLNALFTSGDAFVRIMVGLLLAGLLCEENFLDAKQAEIGLQDVLDENLQRADDLAQDIDICLLLLETNIWQWISDLVLASRAQINTYALLVMTHLQPSDQLVFETVGLHERLLVLCAPEADPCSRYYASKILLSAHRGGTKPPPPQPSLANLCSCLAINFQAKLESDIGQQDMLGAEVGKSSNWSESAASVDGFVEQAWQNTLHLHAESTAWRVSISAAGESTDMAFKCQAQVRNSLHEHSLSLDAAGLAVGDGCPSEEEVRLLEQLAYTEDVLAQREHEYSQREYSVQLLAEERNQFTESLVKYDEVAWQLQSSITEAEEADQAVASSLLEERPGIDIDESRLKHAETLQSIASMRVQAEMLDEQLSEMCEPLPRAQNTVSQDRRAVDDLKADLAALQKNSGEIDTWAGLLDRQRECGEDLHCVRRSLRDVRSSVTSERERRRQLRCSVAHLMESLSTLDSQLASLEAWDDLEDQGQEQAWSPWAAHGFCA